MRGIVYCAVSNPIYATYLRASIKSLRRVGYAGPISVVSDLNLNIDAAIILPDSYHSPKEAKIKTFISSPYDETIFLDCDTYAMSPIDELWDYTDHDASFAIAAQPTIGSIAHGSASEKQLTIKECGADSIHYNSGVAVWKGNPKLWTEWLYQWSRFKDVDELALSRAIVATGATIGILPRKMNRHLEMNGQLPQGDVVIWHDATYEKYAMKLCPELFDVTSS